MAYICTSCQKYVKTPGKFCPFCGQQNIEEEIGVSFGVQLKIYVLSFILAPIGIYWFVKYFREEDPAKRKVGYIALIITLVVILGTLILTGYTFNKLNSIYSPTLELYEGLGI